MRESRKFVDWVMVMHKIAQAGPDERRALFHNTAIKLGLSDAIVEKDFWVCWTLDYLFHESPWSRSFTFKGGTSLSKCFGLIKRFSEDIDLIIDWRQLGYSVNDPWLKRSNTQQEKYCVEINQRTADFLAEQFLPELRLAFGTRLKDIFTLSIDERDPLTVCFDYPKCFQANYVLSTIRLEIGALAAWTPAAVHKITSYAAEEYGRLFEHPDTNVLTVAAERTFWEKITILHKEAFRSNGILPGRYSRHYYDLYCMSGSPIKELAFSDLDLLERVVDFKARFYRSNAARYDLARPGSMKLMPPADSLKVLEDDYRQMGDMIFGEKPTFQEIMNSIRKLEIEINQISRRI